MPTTPFTAALVSRLAGPTAWRFDSRLGPVFTPRFFCCSDPNDLGIADGKEPVAVIDLSPNPALVGETVNYTGTASYDPDGSITTYAWTFESHTPSSGTVSAGTLNYGTAGTYTIQLVVTDGTSLKSPPARTELVVNDPNTSFDVYAATSSGVFYTTGGTVSWQDKNTGLSGDALNVWKIIIDPTTQPLPAANRVLWRGTTGGIYVSRDGGASWANKAPTSVSNPWTDSPAPAVGSLDYRDLLFSGDRLFALATWQNASAAWRSWLLYTDNAADMRAGTAGSVSWSEI